jgi:pyruvate kinase
MLCPWRSAKPRERRRHGGEAESHLQSNAYVARGESASLTGLVDPITEAAADAACLVARQLNAALIVVVAAASGRSALALSNRRPSAPVLALARTEEVARVLSLCWGVEALLLPDAHSVEQQLSFGVNWAKSHGLVRRPARCSARNQTAGPGTHRGHSRRRGSVK